jgi:hypothetical protein
MDPPRRAKPFERYAQGVSGPSGRRQSLERPARSATPWPRPLPSGSDLLSTRLLGLFTGALHEIDLPAAALGADQPLAPIEDRGVGAIALGELGGVDFDLIVAIKFSFTIGG